MTSVKPSTFPDNGNNITKKQELGTKENPISPELYEMNTKNLQKKHGFAMFNGHYFISNTGEDLGFQYFGESGEVRIGYFNTNLKFLKEKNRENISITIGKTTNKLKVPEYMKVFFEVYFGAISQKINESEYANNIELGKLITSEFQKLLKKEQELRKNEPDKITDKHCENISKIIAQLDTVMIKVVEIPSAQEGFKRLIQSVIK